MFLHYIYRIFYFLRKREKNKISLLHDNYFKIELHTKTSNMFRFPGLGN